MCVTEEEGSLKHERQTFHGKVEMPGDHSVHLALPMPTAINGGSTHLDLSVTIEPLMATNAARKELARLE